MNPKLDVTTLADFEGSTHRLDNQSRRLLHLALDHMVWNHLADRTAQQYKRFASRLLLQCAAAGTSLAKMADDPSLARTAIAQCFTKAGWIKSRSHFHTLKFSLDSELEETEHTIGYVAGTQALLGVGYIFAALIAEKLAAPQNPMDVDYALVPPSILGGGPASRRTRYRSSKKGEAQTNGYFGLVKPARVPKFEYRENFEADVLQAFHRARVPVAMTLFCRFLFDTICRISEAAAANFAGWAIRGYGRDVALPNKGSRRDFAKYGYMSDALLSDLTEHHHIDASIRYALIEDYRRHGARHQIRMPLLPSTRQSPILPCYFRDHVWAPVLRAADPASEYLGRATPHWTRHFASTRHVLGLLATCTERDLALQLDAFQERMAWRQRETLNIYIAHARHAMMHRQARLVADRLDPFEAADRLDRVSEIQDLIKGLDGHA